MSTAQLRIGVSGLQLQSGRFGIEEVGGLWTCSSFLGEIMDGEWEWKTVVSANVQRMFECLFKFSSDGNP